MQRHIQLGQRIHFQLDLDHMSHAGTSTSHRRGDISGQCNVVVLDEYGVVQAKTVVAAATDTHGVLLQGSQARHGLARTGHSSAEGLDGLCNRMRGAGHATEMAKVVERRTLGRENGSAFATNAGDLHAWLQQRAVCAADVKLHASIHQHKGQTCQIKSGQDSILPGHQTQLAHRIGRNNGVGGQVCGTTQIFQQGHAYQRLQHYIGQGWDGQGCNFINAHFEYF